MKLNMLNKNFDIKYIKKVIVYYLLIVFALHFFIPRVIEFFGFTLVLPVWFSLMFIGIYNSFKIREYISDNYHQGNFISSIEIWKVYKQTEDRKIQIFRNNLQSFIYLIGIVFISLPFIGFFMWIPWIEVYTDVFVNKIFD